MRARTWTVVVVVVALLAAGLALLLLGAGETATSPAPTPSPSRAATEQATASPSPSPPPPPPPTPGPLLYTVREGDTLASIAADHGVSLEDLIAANGIGDPNLIHPGQVLVIPGHVATPQPAPSPAAPPIPGPTTPPLPPPPTPTPAGPPLVEIAGVVGTGDLDAEAVRVRNRGGPASLEGWTLADGAGNRFTFPRLVLFPGGEVTVHSGTGQSTPLHLYWGRAEPAWEPGELITLRDREGVVVDTYIAP